MPRKAGKLYPQNRCARFGQSRFGPVKRTALDGKVWWRVFDYSRCSEQGKFRTRRSALVQMASDFRNYRLKYDPDPGFSRTWLMGLSMHELACLVDKPATPGGKAEAKGGNP